MSNIDKKSDSFWLFDEKKLEKVIHLGIHHNQIFDKLRRLKLIHTNHETNNETSTERLESPMDSSTCGASTEETKSRNVWLKPYTKHNFRRKCDNNNESTVNHHINVYEINQNNNGISNRLRTPTTSPFPTYLRRPNTVWWLHFWIN